MSAPLGIIAAGHAHTAAAGAAMLREGGNAFDAVVAAHLAACVAEPVLTSLGGGGFLMARRADGLVRAYDFFAHTPRRRRPAAETHFFPVHADFGPATQRFYIGRGAIATPGLVRGLFRIQRDLCSLPMTVLAAPAIEHARSGCRLTGFQQYLFGVVGAILRNDPDCAARYSHPDRPGEFLGEGDLHHQPELGDVIEALAREGDALFYRGEIGERLARACSEHGGHLTREDLERYRVMVRAPLRRTYHGARVNLNPPPASGGQLVALALELLGSARLAAAGFGSLGHITALAETMAIVDGLRPELAAPAFRPAMERLRAELQRRCHSRSGTTHVSVIDSAGNAASLTASNGEGSGYVLPGTGIMLNNMLGEEDIHPAGAGNWRPDIRISSMMTPTIVDSPDAGLVATGSGGSNRIRSAILQTLVNLLDFGMSPEEAVDAPRIHFEEGLLSLEPGLPPATMERLQTAFPRLHAWETHNLFFGGAHTVLANPASKRYASAPDARRNGAGAVVWRGRQN